MRPSALAAALELFGSEGRTAATGRGVLDVLAEALEEQERSFKDVTVALQGFGNVGSHAARLIAERGARVVAVAFSSSRSASCKKLSSAWWAARSWLFCVAKSAKSSM